MQLLVSVFIFLHGSLVLRGWYAELLLSIPISDKKKHEQGGTQRSILLTLAVLQR